MEQPLEEAWVDHASCRYEIQTSRHPGNQLVLHLLPNIQLPKTCSKHAAQTLFRL